MAEIRFYHLTRKTLEQALPEMLEKTMERNLRAVVMADSAERVEALTQHLWTYSQNSFLPHGSKKDGNPAEQPIWLTEQDERPNEAAILFLTDGSQSSLLNEYQRVCEIFHGDDEMALTNARSRWTIYKNDGHQLSYWQQTERGWVEKTAG